MKGKRAMSYLVTFKHGYICTRTEEPDLSEIPEIVRDWALATCEEAHEGLPVGTPKTLGKCIVTASYHDENVYHNLVVRTHATGSLHLINKISVD